MIAARITSKGQITVPKRVRDALGLAVGDRIEFTIENTQEARIRPARKGDLGRLKGILADRVPYSGREAERNAAVRQAVVEALDLPEGAEIEPLDG